MRLAILKQPRFYLPASLVLILGVVSAVVFHPAFQKKMLLDHVGPLVDSLEIGYIHFTPWSLDLKNVSLGYQGGHFSVGEGTLRYCLSSLLLMNLNIKTLALKDVSIDLEQFNPPETVEKESGGPFPGVLASLEHGLGYILQEIMIDAAVHLPGKRALTARISGGGIKPEASGAITVVLRFDTGNGNDHVTIDGSLGLDQLTRGRFALVETALAIQASLEKLPETERVNLDLTITPAQAAAGQEESPGAEGDDGKPRLTPESLHFALRLPDNEGGVRSALDLEGVYDGNAGGIEGGYRVTANERLVQPYVKDVIPPSAEVLTGEYRLNSTTLTGDMTVTSDLQVKEIREVKADNSLPDMLQLRNNFRVSLLPGMQLRVETLDTTVSDNADNRPLATRLPGDLQIPMDDFAAFLRQENTLLEFELPGVPLIWFNVFLPDYQITDGVLKAGFELTTDAGGAIHIKPVKPLKVNGLTVRQQDEVLIQGFNMSALPSVNYSGDALGVTLKKLVIDAGSGELATADLDAAIPLSGGGDITAQARADLELHRLLDVLAIKPTGRTTLPRHLAMETRAALRQKPGLLAVNTLDASLSLENKTSSLVKLHLLQPLLMESTPAGRKLGNPAGKLATLTLDDIDLNWFSAFVPDATLKGRLSRADLTLTADGEGTATLTSDRPVSLRHVTVASREGPLLDDLGISLRPVIHIAPAGTRIDYKDLGVTSRRVRLVSGSGWIMLPASPDKPLVTDGHLSVDVQALARQPLITRALQAGIDAPVRLEADYSLSRDDAAIDIERLSAGLFYTDPEPRVSLRADSRLRVRTRLGGRQSELRRTTGKVTLALAQLTPEPFANILKTNGLAFTTATGKAVLASNGGSLTVDTIEPFRIAGLAVKNPGGAVLNPFTLVVDSQMTLEGDTLQAKLDELSVAFERDKGVQAIEARADLALKGDGDAVSLESLNADLSASLPSVLDQPAILPGHTLTAGRLTASARKDSDGKFSLTTRIGDLKARKTLALQTLTLDVDGRLADDGGFTLTAPLREQGKSGDSDIQVKAGYEPAGGSNKVVDVAIDSTVFYLNDILNTLNSIAGKQRAAPSEENKPAANDGSPAAEQELQALNLKPDERAFWDTSDYDARVKFRLDRLFYTDYLEFRDIQGHAALLPDKLELADFSMHFHDSPITLDGRMSFAPGEAPYDLKLRAGVEQLDLARFFRELVPGSTPRAEGLFDVSLNAFGSSPNLPEYRNRLYFDMRLQSRDGVFRPFNPDSALLAGSSGFAGVLGEGVSNIPTGLFGLGAVSRLVNYMKEIEYDKIDIHLVRDESRDVQIRQYLVQSPEILMTATGGIKYREGVDIIDSPLNMEASLDMRERGAAILYSLGLLQSEKDSYGYWKGPVFKVWGNVARSESNLDDIISDAGHGAVLGGITRPISGLWGNLRYWWFGGGEEPAAIDQP